MSENSPQPRSFEISPETLDDQLRIYNRQLDPWLFDGAPIAQAAIYPLSGGHHSINRLVVAGDLKLIAKIQPAADDGDPLDEQRKLVYLNVVSGFAPMPYHIGEIPDWPHAF